MRRLLLTLSVLALIAAACNGAVDLEPTPSPTPTPIMTPAPTPGLVETTPPSPEPTTTSDEATSQECTNDEESFTVAFPADWSTNTEPIDHIAPCSVFDPDPEQLRSEGMSVPADIAVSIYVDQVPMEDVLDDDFVEETDRREGSVDGRDAVRRELRHTGDGLYPEGQRSTQWVVDLDGQTLFAISHDVGEPDYAEKQRVLDQMIESLRLEG